MRFNKKAKEHLSIYKVKNMKILECGTWINNNKAYSYILPNNQKNILPLYRNQLLNTLNKHENQYIKLHTVFHHMNSSQALCFNFFFL